MSIALERYLKDFGAPQTVQPVLDDFSSENFHSDVFPAFDEPIEQPASDPESIRAEAYAEGYETAAAESAARHEDALRTLQEQHAQELDNLKQFYQQEAASRLAADLRALAGELAERISNEIGACLTPLLQEEIGRKAVADLALLVQEAVLEGEAGPIIVKGPLPLFNILATEMGEDAGLLRHVEADDLDLTVEISGSVLITRLSAFAASLKKVME